MVDEKGRGSTPVGWWIAAVALALAAWWIFSGGNEAAPPDLGSQLTDEAPGEEPAPEAVSPPIVIELEGEEVLGGTTEDATDPASPPSDPASPPSPSRVGVEEVAIAEDRAGEPERGREEPLDDEESQLTEADWERLLREALVTPPPEVLVQLREEARREPSQQQLEGLRRRLLETRLPSDQEIERMRREAAIGPTEEDLERLREQAERFGDPWSP